MTIAAATGITQLEDPYEPAARLRPTAHSASPRSPARMAGRPHVIPVFQRGTHDCVRACLASIFEVRWEDAPATDYLEPGWTARDRAAYQSNVVNEWLRARGLIEWSIDSTWDPPVLRRGIEIVNGDRRPSDEIAPTPWSSHHLGSGPSPRGFGMWHTVVMYGGRIVHDPHSAGDMTIGRIHAISIFVARV